MDMLQLFNDYRKHIESLDDDAIRQSIAKARESYKEGFDDGCKYMTISIFGDIDNLDWYHIDEYGEVVQGSNSDHETFYKAKDIFDVLAKYGYEDYDG